MSIPELISCQSLYNQYDTNQKHTWCSSCGNYAILSALKRALALEQILPHQCLLCFDVGCNGNVSDKIAAYTIHGLHGRVLPLAAGAALANSSIPVIASAGDGATLSEGIGHLIHAVRNDYPVTFIHHNNMNYGLTTGQPSSTTPRFCKMNAAPEGVMNDPLNPTQLVLSLNPSFVARSYTGDVDHMTAMIRSGIKHNGFSYIEIFQNCPTYNKATPLSWYQERIRYIEDDKNYINTDIWHARKKVETTSDEIWIGQIYYHPHTKSYLEKDHSVRNDDISLVDQVQAYDISSLL